MKERKQEGLIFLRLGVPNEESQERRGDSCAYPEFRSVAEVVYLFAANDGDGHELARDEFLNGRAGIAQEADHAHSRAGNALRHDVDSHEAAHVADQSAHRKSVEGHAEHVDCKGMGSPDEAGDGQGVQDAVQQGRFIALVVEELVGNEAAQESAEDTGNLHVGHDAGCAHDVVALFRREVDDAPAFDGVAGDVYAKGRQAENPDGRVFDDGVPLLGADGFFLFRVDLFLRLFAVVDGAVGKTHRFGTVAHAEVNEDRADQGNDTGGDEAHGPVVGRYDGGDGEIGEGRTEVMARKPYAVQGAALLVAEPLVQGDDGRACAVGLEPAVEAP